MKIKSQVNTRLFTIYIMSMFADEITDFMLSFENRLANVRELANFMRDMTIETLKAKGFILTEDDEKENEDLLLCRIIESVDFMRAAESVYKRVYNTAMLARIVNTKDVNTDIHALLQKMYAEYEDEFFNDKNLETFFRLFKDLS